MDRPSFLPFATSGIGSLPHGTDAAAWDYMLSAYPEIPFVPELLRAGPAQGLVASLWPPEWVTGIDQGVVHLDPDRSWHDLGQAIDALRPAEVPRFRSTVGQLSGRQIRSLLKVQCCGPLTALSSTHLGPLRLWDQPPLRARVAAWIERLTVALAEVVRAPGGVALVVLDEPAAADPALDPANPANVTLYASIFDALHGAGASTGIHCCGRPPIDLLLLIDVDWASFDAVTFENELRAHPRALERYLRRGSTLALGVIDARQPETAAQIVTRVERLRLDRSPGIVLTPTCGTGLRTEDEERRVAQILQEASRTLRGRMTT